AAASRSPVWSDGATAAARAERHQHSEAMPQTARRRESAENGAYASPDNGREHWRSSPNARQDSGDLPAGGDHLVTVAHHYRQRGGERLDTLAGGRPAPM